MWYLIIRPLEPHTVNFAAGVSGHKIAQSKRYIELRTKPVHMNIEDVFNMYTFTRSW